MVGPCLCLLSSTQLLQDELKDREPLVLSTLDQARAFLADQPIEGPEEPGRNLQARTGERLHNQWDGSCLGEGARGASGTASLGAGGGCCAEFV